MAKEVIYLGIIFSIAFISLVLSSLLTAGDLPAKRIKVSESDTKGYLALFNKPSGNQKIKTTGQSLYYENSKLYVDGAEVGGNIDISKLDIDGGTDIGAALVDADLIIVDDGAGGINRKCAVSRLKTYIGTGTSTIDGLNDAKKGGTNFTNSIKIGSATTGTLNDAKNNTILGIGTMDKITTAYNNIAIGYDTGSEKTTGHNNVFIGVSVANDSTGINRSVIIGSEIGANFSAGPHGAVLIGYNAGKGHTYGGNTAIGYQAGYSDTVSPNFTDFNTFLGYHAGYGVTGNGNTFIGHGLITTFSGANNTCLGRGASPSATSISNEVVFGNDDITTIRCQVTTITALSDRRDKKDIIDNPYGLDFIDKIRPVEFTWDRRGGGGGNNGKTRLGFIAQELQEAMPNSENEILNLVYDSNPDRLEITQGNLIPILVKAIQELKAEIDILKSNN
jgi:trimeric autotransporter adhesin